MASRSSESLSHSDDGKGSKKPGRTNVTETTGLFRPEVDVSSVNERKLMRRIDWHVVPVRPLHVQLYIDDQQVDSRILVARSLVPAQVCRDSDKLNPTMSLTWRALSFLDRGSIGNAKLYNLEQDLHITDRQYLIALTVFFFPYALFEVSDNPHAAILA